MGLLKSMAFFEFVTGLNLAFTSLIFKMEYQYNFEGSGYTGLIFFAFVAKVFKSCRNQWI